MATDLVNDQTMVIIINFHCPNLSSSAYHHSMSRINKVIFYADDL